MISDAHEGLKATLSKVLHATWQRCRVHFTRNALAYAGKSGRRAVSAFIATAFAQEDAKVAQRNPESLKDVCLGAPYRLADLLVITDVKIDD